MRRFLAYLTESSLTLDWLKRVLMHSTPDRARREDETAHFILPDGSVWSTHEEGVSHAFAVHPFPLYRVLEELRVIRVGAPDAFECAAPITEAQAVAICAIFDLSSGTQNIVDCMDGGESFATTRFPKFTKPSVIRNWVNARFSLTEATSVQSLDRQLMRAGSHVDGRRVTDNIPSMSSIAASLTDYEILDDVRDLPLSLFDPDNKPSFYSTTEKARVEHLAELIKRNGWIDPLIVVFDHQRYPYVLEGGHRFDALKLLHAKALPALVVVDTERVPLTEVAADPIQQLKTLLPKGTNPQGAGFVLPDGTYLSLGHYGLHDTAAHLVNQSLLQLMQRGVARFDGRAGITVAAPLTSAAATTVHDLFGHDPVLVDIMNPKTGRVDTFKELTRHTADTIRNVTRRQLSESASETIAILKAPPVKRGNRYVFPVSDWGSTKFLLPDGTRLGTNEETHADAARALDLDLYDDIMSAGIMRITGSNAFEVGAPITETQARMIVDAYHYSRVTIFGDVFNGRKRSSKQFDEHITADQVRRWVNSQFNMQEAVIGGRDAAVLHPPRPGESLRVYHAFTAGVPTEIHTDIGSDYDVFGKGFYFGTYARAANYGTPHEFLVTGRFATQQQWVDALKQHDAQHAPFASARVAARQQLQAAGYVGIMSTDTGVVWVDSAVELIEAANEHDLIATMRAKYPKTTAPSETWFILPDGTRIDSGEEATHMDAAEALGVDLADVLRAGIIRSKAGDGVELARTITEAQARVIFDDYKFYHHRDLNVDVFYAEHGDWKVRQWKALFIARDQLRNAGVLRDRINAFVRQSGISEVLELDEDDDVLVEDYVPQRITFSQLDAAVDALHGV